MTHIDMLKDPAFKRSLENKIVAHINTEYMKAGMSPPLPKFRNDVATYDEENVTKLAKRIRVGIVLLAQTLDEACKDKGGENA
ncbi:hypothetical protein [Acinetobacter towneri]|uniref:Uncharacterized protein n=1 Tax=Acinetobacter towneri TaxID=202956 RepID=A0AB35LXV8_9GAMM|nr:hypothetical protein [Acinetobacter towneri]MDM1718073.1 hypothetical protein [Acinetobacter towneri]MDM1734684.1 hypothetical protein [Acinetobacter towneri]MDM1738023.1 hypothetical protein [Acinetobacter towneri]MDM1741795.1 hypothetical protein [Acinetobacter towneri]MDM1745259.1 hypothetical protein [Acinetobacter towneri]